MWKCAADSHGEIRGESGAAILGVFGVSEVPDDAESLRDRAMKKSRSARAQNKSLPFSHIVHITSTPQLKTLSKRYWN